MIKYKSLILLFLLNMFDLFFTYAGLKIHAIEEANPIMAYFYELHPFMFVFMKIFAVVIGIFFIAKIIEKTWVKNAVKGLNTLYLFIFFLHIRNTFLIVSHIV